MYCVGDDCPSPEGMHLDLTGFTANEWRGYVALAKSLVWLANIAIIGASW